MEFKLSCPVCDTPMQADTPSGEEFSCHYCSAMVDILDDDLTMISLPPHQDIGYIPTSGLRWKIAVPAW